MVFQAQGHTLKERVSEQPTGSHLDQGVFGTGFALLHPAAWGLYDKDDLAVFEVPVMQGAINVLEANWNCSGVTTTSSGRTWA